MTYSECKLNEGRTPHVGRKMQPDFPINRNRVGGHSLLGSGKVRKRN